VLDFDVDNMFPFLVMDYAPGGTLRQRHPRGTKVPLPTVVDYVTHIASALDYAHGKKLIHCDVKPENMLLNQQGQIVLSDFGVASIAHNTQSQKLAEVAGTISYIAPEQIQGHPRLASDQYALGIVVYEWLSGERPFRGSFAEIASQHLLTPPPALHGRVPGISQAIEDVLFLALAKDPRDRFVTTQAFATALAKASQQDTPRNTPSADSSFAFLPATSNDMAPTQPLWETELSTSPMNTPISPHSVTQLDTPQRIAQVQLVRQLSPSKSRMPSRAPRRNPLAVVVGMIVLVVLSIAGGVLYAFAQTGGLRLNMGSHSAITTNSRAGTHTTGTVSATNTFSSPTATPTADEASVNATAQADAASNATATAASKATATASAIAKISPQQLYKMSTSGQPTFVDPLIGPDKNGWSNIGGCVFRDGKYHAIVAANESFLPCSAENTNFCNMTYQVQMTILGGDGGGPMIRSNMISSNFAYGDRVRVGPNGSYDIVNPEKALQPNAFSPAIHTGYNTTNLVTLIARGSDLYLYINKQFVTHVTDTTTVCGQIGLMSVNFTKAVDVPQLADVAFSNIQIWTF
jgi:serine/threonine protein kinase